ncbi:Chromo domain-containing protein [Fusarium keratoplasticum]|nr:Chromo domain-containing protein [Fusarium keratoplasticum]
MDNLRVRADLRLPLLEAEGQGHPANGWSSTVTWLKLPKAPPRVGVAKGKLMANLEVAGTLFIYNTLPVVLTNPRYIVETIKSHEFRKNLTSYQGSLVFQVKWKGFESETDLTWEPEKNLTASGDTILKEYFDSIGGRPKPKTYQESGKAANTKRRAETSKDNSSTTHKRLRRTKAQVTDESLLATTEKWKPPLGSWEDEVEKIDGGEEDDNGKLIIYIIWKNGQETKHGAPVIYKKCPQKMLQFYEARIKIVKNE